MWPLRTRRQVASWRLYVLGMMLFLGISSFATASGLEGIEWQLSGLHGAVVAPLPGGRQPTLRLDAEQSKASGFAGCNNYFTQYELDNKKLKFGPVAATRRACPDAESVIERNFFAVLEQTRSWQIKDGKLTLYNGAGELASFTIKQVSGARADLDSLVVRSSVYTKALVTLRQGEYRTPAAPGSASAIVVKLTDKRAFGQLAGIDIGAVVIATETGGSGTFYELALLTKGPKGWVNSDTVLLGDRVKVNAVAIEANRIVVDMKTHGPNDPQCCPTRESTKRYAVNNGRLVAIAADEALAQPQLVGTTWQWVQSRYNNDTQAIPPRPENYTVQFKQDSKINIKADCNLKSGTYTTDGKQLSITILNSTMAACEPGSLEEPFVRDLTAAVIYFFQDGNLYIDLKYDSGTMKFSRGKMSRDKQ